MVSTLDFPSRQEICRRLSSQPRDISSWLIPAAPYRRWDLDFSNHYVEHFLEKGPWAFGDTATYDMRLSRWGYHWVNKTQGAQYTYQEKPVDPSRPWAVEAEIQIVELEEKSLVGLLLGFEKTTRDKATFLINPLQQVFSVSTHIGGRWDHLTSRAYTPAVGDYHLTLRVENGDGYWHYFVDDWLVFVHPTGTLPGPGFGVFTSHLVTVDVVRLQVQW